MRVRGVCGSGLSRFCGLGVSGFRFFLVFFGVCGGGGGGGWGLWGLGVKGFRGYGLGRGF